MSKKWRPDVFSGSLFKIKKPKKKGVCFKKKKKHKK